MKKNRITDVLSRSFGHRFSILCLLTIFSATLPIGYITSQAHNLYESSGLYGSWQKDEKGWWFENQGNPAYAFSRWGEYQGHSYYFDANGYMVTGWQNIDNYWYYFNPMEGEDQGIMMSGWHYDSNVPGWFYLNSNGIMVTGWHKIDGYWYYFNPDPAKTLGLMAVSQVVDKSYVDASGKINELPD